jgi:hypothetical protein
MDPETLTTFIKSSLFTAVILEVFHYWRDNRKAKNQGDTSLQLSDKQELSGFRQYLAVKADSLEEVREQIKEEKHQLEMKIVILERDLIDEKRLTSDQNEEIISLNAECNRLNKELAHFKKISEREIVSD